MKFTHSTKKSTGIGLIEVLITTVVVAVGLLAVASLQEDLISGSRSNKTRAEAKALADSKIEELRDTIEKNGTSGYDTLLNATGSPFSDPNNPILGTTEQFNRSWAITDQTNPVSKQISVTVCWPSTACTDQVVAQSIIAFDGVGNSVLAAKGAGAAAGAALSGLSLNAESSTDISKSITLPTSAAPGSVVTVNGKTYIVQNTGIAGSLTYSCSDTTLGLTEFENNLFTRRVNNDNVAGNEAIELFEKVTISGLDYCTPKLRFNGGVIIPIRGIVHSGATTGSGHTQTLLDVNLFTFNATETGTYCYFNPQPNAKSAPYVCYVGGNCTGFTGTTDDTDVTQCPTGSYASTIVGPGGWRGKVGLLGVATRGNNVCFAEEIAAAPATLDTARNYYTRNAGVNEGINKPYSCHDFLIINGKNTEAQVHSECVTQANAIGGFRLASKTIQRDISGNNVFDPLINVDYCPVVGTAYTITGTITNAASAPVVTVTDGIVTNPCTSTATSYSCQITTAATSVAISGIYNAETKTCSLTPPSTSGCSLSFTATVNPTYTINGTIIGTSAAANAVTLALSGGGSCVNNNNNNGTYNTYTCTLTTVAATTSATLTATIATGGTVTPSTPQTITLPGSTATLTGPDFSATMAATYTISGSISIGNNVSLTTVTVAVDTGAGTCTLTGSNAQNTSDTYSCTVPGPIPPATTAPNHLTIAISPACSTGGGSKKYQLTDGTTITLGTGSLVITFPDITGNVSKNITITKSTTNC